MSRHRGPFSWIAWLIVRHRFLKQLRQGGRAPHTSIKRESFGSFGIGYNFKNADGFWVGADIYMDGSMILLWDVGSERRVKEFPHGLWVFAAIQVDGMLRGEEWYLTDFDRSISGEATP